MPTATLTMTLTDASATIRKAEGIYWTAWTVAEHRISLCESRHGHGWAVRVHDGLFVDTDRYPTEAKATAAAKRAVLAAVAETVDDLF
jgi:hypothetical protein